MWGLIALCACLLSLGAFTFYDMMHPYVDEDPTEPCKHGFPDHDDCPDCRH